MTIQEQIQKVIEARTLFRLEDGFYRQSKVDWELAHTNLIANREKATVALLEAETTLKQMAVDLYDQTQNRRPAPGLEVKLFQVLEYPQKEALAWGLKTGLGVKLDKDAFDKIAKVSPMSFVSIRMEPRCQIAEDLGKALANGEGVGP